ncbi:uncharacterized protein FIBRA_07267 [Fibroporia radiculosa]|uniref:BTB domain-containing protein n=1 Tax=Fibroporia radiculosa TaxID=599839 RepID=J4IBQ3_9APHY|nr:uncharacterized protein FIBRA_07267 [Fibroporia radiculosa]CCM05061.1 predicted protein [Fibroporia radiculosa]
MTALNPPHILIARNSRGQGGANPSASLSSPAETHAAAAGILGSAGSPPRYLEEESDEMLSALSLDSDFEIDPTFTETNPFPGTIKIIVESIAFWAHKEVLYFASSFFQAALSGAWAETGRPQSVSSVITISQQPTVRGGPSKLEASPQMTFARAESDMDVEDVCIDSDLDTFEDGPVGRENARETSLTKLEGASAPSSNETSPVRSKGKQKYAVSRSQAKHHRKKKRPDAVILLKEERASTFHDFLKYVYPHLACTITWNNVEGLLNIAHRLHVSALEEECLTFLITHAAGRPLKAMSIAELFEREDLYCEASRFVLDNPEGWSEQELNSLSKETLLKLEKRRTWFLERVLKLGLVQVAKEYQCCATCPDPPTCARLLEEKWQQAYRAVNRFGPCQPSMVFRYLRTLEGISPPLSLTHLSCQTTAKAFIATLFDRMFSLGLRGSGTDIVPLGTLGTRVAAVSTGPRRHFLFCTLKNEQPPRGKRSRELV